MEGSRRSSLGHLQASSTRHGHSLARGELDQPRRPIQRPATLIKKVARRRNINIMCNEVLKTAFKALSLSLQSNFDSARPVKSDTS